MSQSMPPMHICFDYSAALQQGAGIGRYGREMLLRLRTALGDEQLSIFANNRGRVPMPPQVVGLRRYSVGLNNKSWRTRVALDYLLDRDLDRYFPQVDLFFGADHLLPRFKYISSIINIRDLSYLLQPHYHPFPSRMFQQQMMPHFARHASHIVVPSHATQRDLESSYGLEAKRITVIPEGVDERFRTPITAARKRAVRQAYQLPHPFILYVGTLEPRKNIIGLLDAFASFLTDGMDRRVDLVLAGGLGWLYQPTLDHLRALGLGERVQHIGYVADTDLPALYAAAEVFVFPSWYEGFGLPPLEAMAVGTPVVASNVASLPEVIGAAGLLVDPADTHALAGALHAVLTNPQLHEQLAHAGQIQAAHFTWERTATATLALCWQVINAHRA